MDSNGRNLVDPEVLWLPNDTEKSRDMKAYHEEKKLSHRILTYKNHHTVKNLSHRVLTHKIHHTKKYSRFHRFIIICRHIVKPKHYSGHSKENRTPRLRGGTNRKNSKISMDIDLMVQNIVEVMRRNKHDVLKNFTHDFWVAVLKSLDPSLMKKSQNQKRKEIKRMRIFWDRNQMDIQNKVRKFVIQERERAASQKSSKTEGHNSEQNSNTGDQVHIMKDNVSSCPPIKHRKDISAKEEMSGLEDIEEDTCQSNKMLENQQTTQRETKISQNEFLKTLHLKPATHLPEIKRSQRTRTLKQFSDSWITEKKTKKERKLKTDTVLDTARNKDKKVVIAQKEAEQLTTKIAMATSHDSDPVQTIAQPVKKIKSTVSVTSFLSRSKRTKKVKRYSSSWVTGGIWRKRSLKNKVQSSITGSLNKIREKEICPVQHTLTKTCASYGPQATVTSTNDVQETKASPEVAEVTTQNNCGSKNIPLRNEKRKRKPKRYSSNWITQSPELIQQEDKVKGTTENTLITGPCKSRKLQSKRLQCNICCQVYQNDQPFIQCENEGCKRWYCYKCEKMNPAYNNGKRITFICGNKECNYGVKIKRLRLRKNVEVTLPDHEWSSCNVDTHHETDNTDKPSSSWKLSQRDNTQDSNLSEILPKIDQDTLCLSSSMLNETLELYSDRRLINGPRMSSPIRVSPLLDIGENLTPIKKINNGNSDEMLTKKTPEPNSYCSENAKNQSNESLNFSGQQQDKSSSLVKECSHLPDLPSNNSEEIWDRCSERSLGKGTSICNKSELPSNQQDLMNGEEETNHKDLMNSEEEVVGNTEKLQLIQNILGVSISINNDVFEYTTPEKAYFTVCGEIFERCRKSESDIEIQKENKGKYSQAHRYLKNNEWQDEFITGIELSNPYCTVGFKRHSVASQFSKRAKSYFTCYGYCTNEMCNVKFKITMNFNYECTIHYENRDCKHDIQSAKSRRVIGNVRRQLKKHMQENNVKPKVLYDNKFLEMKDKDPKVLLAGNFTRVPKSKEVYQKMNSEARKESRLAEDVFTALQRLKTKYEEEDNQPEPPSGFIQVISLFPFFVICHTKQQLQMAGGWGPNSMLTWDATGSIIHEEVHGKHLLFYEIVMKDLHSDFSAPVSCLISAEQSAPVMLHWLQWICHQIKKCFGYKKQWKPARVISDRAWVLILAALQVFNNMTLKDYLETCWKINNGELNESLLTELTIVRACAGHVMHDVSHYNKKHYSGRPLGMYMFSLLLNCETLSEVKAVLEDICVILCSEKYTPGVRKKVKDIELRAQNLGLEKNEDKNSESSHDLGGDINIIKTIFNSESDSLHKSKSPYALFCSKIVNSLMDEINQNVEEDLIDNPYKGKDYFLAIMKNFIPTLPLWTELLSGDLCRFQSSSRCMTNKERKNNERTNARSENRMGYIKNQLLHKTRVRRVDDFIPIIKKNYDSSTAQFVVNNLKVPKSQKRLNKETWGKSQKRKRRHLSFQKPPAFEIGSVGWKRRKCEEAETDEENANEETKLHTNTDQNHCKKKIPFVKPKKPIGGMELVDKMDSIADSLEVLSGEEKMNGMGHNHPNESKSYTQITSEIQTTGLPNIGNSCWFNAVTQAFVNLNSLRQILTRIILDDDDIISRLAHINVIKELQESKITSANMNKELTKAIERVCKKTKNFTRNSQQDVGEYLESSFGEELKAVGLDISMEKTKIVSCTSCKFESMTYEHLNNLYTEFSFDLRHSNILTCADLRELLEDSLTKEISERVTWLCERCRSKKATSVSNITHYPQVLLICVKRFNFVGGTLKKIMHKLNIPIKLDLSAYGNTSALDKNYQLSSVISHCGMSPNSGHYVSNIYLKDSKTWLVCDDMQTYVTGQPVGDAYYVVYECDIPYISVAPTWLAPICKLVMKVASLNETNNRKLSESLRCITQFSMDGSQQSLIRLQEYLGSLLESGPIKFINDISNPIKMQIGARILHATIFSHTICIKCQQTLAVGTKQVPIVSVKGVSQNAVDTALNSMPVHRYPRISKVCINCQHLLKGKQKSNTFILEPPTFLLIAFESHKNTKVMNKIELTGCLSYLRDIFYKFVGYMEYDEFGSSLHWVSSLKVVNFHIGTYITVYKLECENVKTKSDDIVSNTSVVPTESGVSKYKKAVVELDSKQTHFMLDSLIAMNDKNVCKIELNHSCRYVTISKSDLLKLNIDEYLCDKIINTFLSLLCRKYNSDFINKSCFLVESLHNLKVFAQFPRPPTSDIWFDHDLVLLPYNTANHWLIFFVYIKEKLVMHVDPLGNVINKERFIQLMKSLELQAFLKKSDYNFEKSSWSLVDLSTKPDFQRQTDSYNCGAHILRTALAVLNGDSPFIPGHTDHLNLFRNVIRYSILNRVIPTQ